MTQNYRNLRWTGRFSGFVGFVFFISFSLGVGIEVFRGNGQSYDFLFVLTLFSFGLVSYIIAWFMEIIGGSLLTLMGIALGLYVAFSPLLAGTSNILIYSLPFVLPGIFFILAWRAKYLATKEQKNSAL
nr:hypothetical protein [Bacteroidota bacterium]